jgi:hypothetical protein
MSLQREMKPNAFLRSYNSFSGVDIKAVFANKPIGELQAISYSITREKAPIYTMGASDPRAFSRGKRGIAGTLVFVVFDRHVLLSTLGGFSPDGGLKFQSDRDDIRADFSSVGEGVSGNIQSLANVQVPPGGGLPFQQESPLHEVDSDQEVAKAWYADQIPPFDVTLAAANEYGALALMRIFGVELLNEGYGVSIDDIVSEQQHTYIARTVIGWTAVAGSNLEKIADQAVSLGG